MLLYFTSTGRSGVVLVFYNGPALALIWDDDMFCTGIAVIIQY